MRGIRIIVSTSLVAVPVVGPAHHSGLYDESDVTSIDGTIVSIDWINPHVRLTLETAPADGDAERWAVEGTSANVLERWGVEREAFVLGDRVRATGPSSRFGRNAMIGATVDVPGREHVVLWPGVAARLGLADTQVDGLFPPPAGSGHAAQPARGIFGVWTPRGRPPAAAAADLPLRASARAEAARYNVLEDDPALRCEPPGMPAMLDTWYPIEFVDAGDRIVIRYEEWDGVRTVHMQPGNGPPVQEHSAKGVSFGRWEDETLAIFTLYIDYPYYDDLGTRQSESVTVLERYTPSADGTRLDWHVTVTDAATFTEPVTQSGHMSFEPGRQIMPYECTLIGA